MSKPTTGELHGDYLRMEAAMSSLRGAIFRHDEELTDLIAERDQLKAENDALREALPHMTITSEQMGMPSLKHQEIKNDDFTEELKEDLRHAIADAFSGPVRPATPRVITADELREGQLIAAKVNRSPWEVAEVEARTDGGGLYFMTSTRYVPATDLAGVTIVLLEDVPAKNVGTTGSTLQENGENFTRSRLTVHQLNVAPVGSVVKGDGMIYVKHPNSEWYEPRGGLWISETIIKRHPTATLHRPAGGPR